TLAPSGSINLIPLNIPHRSHTSTAKFHITIPPSKSTTQIHITIPCTNSIQPIPLNQFHVPILLDDSTLTTTGNKGTITEIQFIPSHPISHF
ncbi:hypothetical protein LINPERHAP2_LOCUS7552, partial [Linum perenne]